MLRAKGQRGSSESIFEKAVKHQRQPRKPIRSMAMRPRTGPCAATTISGIEPDDASHSQGQSNPATLDLKDSATPTVGMLLFCDSITHPIKINFLDYFRYLHRASQRARG